MDLLLQFVVVNSYWWHLHPGPTGPTGPTGNMSDKHGVPCRTDLLENTPWGTCRVTWNVRTDTTLQHPR